MGIPWSAHTAYGLALVLVTAGLTHVSAVLVLPGRSEASAYAVRAAALDGHTLRTLANDGDPGAFADPTLPNAACLYDLRQGPVSASVAVTDAVFAVLSVHDRHGRVLAGLTSRSARDGQLGLTLSAPSGEPSRRSNGNMSPGSPGPTRVEATDPLGFVLAEVLAAEPSEAAGAAAMAATLSCRPASP